MDHTLKIVGSREGHPFHTLGSNRAEHLDEAVRFAKVMEATGDFTHVQIKKDMPSGACRDYITIYDGEVHHG